ncbi:MAG: hypothetical protein Devi2KO_40150 [Devosia indica]
MCVIKCTHVKRFLNLKQKNIKDRLTHRKHWLKPKGKKKGKEKKEAGKKKK